MSAKSLQRFINVEKEISHASSDVELLSRFVGVQYTGFVKVIKKYTKWSGSSGLARRMEPHLGRKSMALKFDFSTCIANISMLYDAVREPSSAQRSGEFGEHLGRIIFWVHRDNIVEIEIFLLKHLTAMTQKTDQESKRNDQMPPNGSMTHVIFFADPTKPTAGEPGTISFATHDSKAHIQIPGRSPIYLKRKEVENWQAQNLKASKRSPLIQALSEDYTYTQVGGSVSAVLSKQVLYGKLENQKHGWMTEEAPSKAFPHAILCLTFTEAAPHWITELNSSHLVEQVPAFSIYTHAAIELLQSTDKKLPWAPLLQKDIRKSPVAEGKKNPLLAVKFPSLSTSSNEASGTEPPTSSYTSLDTNSRRTYWSEFDNPDSDDDFVVDVDEESPLLELASASKPHSWLACLFPSFLKSGKHVSKNALDVDGNVDMSHISITCLGLCILLVSIVAITIWMGGEAAIVKIAASVLVLITLATEAWGIACWGMTKVTGVGWRTAFWVVNILVTMCIGGELAIVWS